MARYSLEQRHAIVTLFQKNNGSIVATQRAYRGMFGRCPAGSSIRRIVRNFNQYFTLADIPRPGRPSTARSEDNIERVRRSVAEDPTISTRRRAVELGLSQTSIARILKKLDYKPYKVHSVRHIPPCNKAQRLEFARKFWRLSKADPNFIKRLITSDESTFYLEPPVNKQNERIWANKNPKVVQIRKRNTKRITVWCGVTYDGIIGPYFFQDNRGKTLNLSGHTYRCMLKEYLMPLLKRRRNHFWFQQDGASAHTCKATISLLKDLFGEKIISRGGNINWPPNSPDLSPPDFFLWGYLKGRVYKNRPRSLEQLKDNIIQEVRAIPRQMLRKVMADMGQRMRMCEREEGGHLKDKIFRTRVHFEPNLERPGNNMGRISHPRRRHTIIPDKSRLSDDGKIPTLPPIREMPSSSKFNYSV